MVDDRLERKWGAKRFPGGLGKFFPRDEPSLEKDFLQKWVRLRLRGGLLEGGMLDHPGQAAR